jgi:hypothetical protein
MNHNIDPALLDNSTTPNPLTNQFRIIQDGSATDGNSMPAGEPVHLLSVHWHSTTEPIVQPADLGHVRLRPRSMGMAWEWTLPRHLATPHARLL